MSVSTHPNEFAADVTVPSVLVELSLDEAEGLHTWLLKATADGVAALDEPLVSAALATLSRAVDDVHVVMNIRRELAGAGVACEHLSDEKVRELGRRVSQALAAGLRD